MASIAEEKYVSLTTFTRDGTPKPVPVWIVDLGDGEVGFTTAESSWKVKRIRNTPGVTLQPCDQRGRVTAGSTVVSGTARLASRPEYERIKGLVRDKYGLWVPIIGAMYKIQGLFKKNEGEAGDGAVVVRLATD